MLLLEKDKLSKYKMNFLNDYFYSEKKKVIQHYQALCEKATVPPS